MENQDDKLDSFYFKETVDGIEHDYRITDMEGKFGIEKDGIVIAEVGNYEEWEQVSGDPLDKELLDRLIKRIEKYYD